MDERPKCKLLEENIEHPLTNPSSIFFDLSPRVMNIQTKIKTKRDLIKLKSFCIKKEIINKMKQKPSE